MDFLKKIQQLPESKRKTILWIVVIIIGLTLATFWLKNFQKILKNLSAKELKTKFQISPLEEKIKEDLPKPEIPEISEEELKQLEEKLKELEQ